MSNQLAGRVVVVTGAAGALGGAISSKLREDGALVFGIDRVDPTARVGAGVAASLSREDEVEKAFDAAARLGPLWGVVHTAGGWQGGTSIAESTLETFEAMLDTNLRTTFLVARAAMRRLVPNRGGRIVTIGAWTAARAQRLAGAAAYAASKAGVISLTQTLAEEGAPHGVRAVCIAPGTMDTPGNRAAMPNADTSHWVPLAEVAHLAASALSPASPLSGAVLLAPEH